MADQEQVRSITDTSVDVDPPNSPHSVFHPSRCDTASSVGSVNQPALPIPPGFYTLPIHGNCPRCHHYHKAATINVKVSSDFSQASHVYCENCDQKWLAFGGGNSTRISLLSTQTTEPDLVERDFRKGLIDMVRSVTSIASPTALASVPEQPSTTPSREVSVSSRNVDQGPGSSQGKAASPRSPISGHSISPAASAGRETLRVDDPTLQTGLFAPGHAQPKAVLRQLKTKVKNRLVGLKMVRLKEWLRSKKGPKVSEKSLGKLPVVQIDYTDDKSVPTKDAQAGYNTVSNRNDSVPAPSVHSQIECQSPAPAPLPPPDDSATIDMLKGMTEEQRIAWVREQFSDFKCRCTNECFCRRVPSSHTPPHTGDVDSTLTNPPPSPIVSLQPPQRRHSSDFLLIGSHLDNFHAGDFFHSTRHSIDSVTRLSQARTMVDSDSITVTSGPPYLGVAPHRQRSRSPRPNSLPPSRLRQSVGPDEVQGRVSIDSITTSGAVGNISHTGTHMGRRSMSSTSDSTTLAHTAAGPSGASTPHINGRRTPDE